MKVRRNIEICLDFKHCKMNENEKMLCDYLIGTSASLNLNTAFVDVCKNLTDKCLFYIIDIALLDWQKEVAEKIILKRTNQT